MTMDNNNISDPTREVDNPKDSSLKDSKMMTEDELLQPSGLSSTPKRSLQQSGMERLRANKVTPSQTKKIKASLQEGEKPPDRNEMEIDEPPPIQRNDDVTMSSGEIMVEQNPSDNKLSTKNEEHQVKQIDSATLKATLNAKSNNTEEDCNTSQRFLTAKKMKASEKSSTKEDDLDTLVSGETLNHDRGINDQVNCWRFQLIIKFHKLDKDDLLKRHNLKTLPDWATSPDKRLRQTLMEWFKELQNHDKELKILAWKKSDLNVISRPEQIPTKEDKRKTFLSNLKRVVEDGTMWPLIRLYTEQDPDDLAQAMKSWCDDRNISMQRSLVQTEYMVKVGLLFFSSHFTDTKLLKARLEKMSGFEWGLKLTYVSKDDEKDDKGKPVKWHLRARAIHLHVSNKHIKEATDLMELVFGYKKKRASRKLRRFFPMSKKIIFQLPEHVLQDKKPSLVNTYNKLKKLHKTYSKGLDGTFTDMFNISIDKEIKTLNHGRLSLRDMLLLIPISNKNTKGLFLDVDATVTGESVYFREGRTGSGNIGHIISFLNSHKSAAMIMVRGLPLYLSTVYGEDTMFDKFTAEAWASIEGWKYNSDTHTFTSPEEEWMEEIIEEDPFTAMLEEEEKRSQEEKKQTSKGTETRTDKASKIAENALLFNLDEKEEDESTVATADMHVVDEVPATKTDDGSVISAVTFDDDTNPKSDHSIVSNESTHSAHSAGTTKACGSVKSMETDTKTLNSKATGASFLNMKKLGKKFNDPGKSAKENKDNQMRYVAHSMKKKFIESMRELYSQATDEELEAMADAHLPLPSAPNISAPKYSSSASLAVETQPEQPSSLSKAAKSASKYSSSASIGVTEDKDTSLKPAPNDMSTVADFTHDEPHQSKTPHENTLYFFDDKLQHLTNELKESVKMEVINTSPCDFDNSQSDCAISKVKPPVYKGRKTKVDTEDTWTLKHRLMYRAINLRSPRARRLLTLHKAAVDNNTHPLPPLDTVATRYFYDTGEVVGSKVSFNLKFPQWNEYDGFDDETLLLLDWEDNWEGTGSDDEAGGKNE